MRPAVALLLTSLTVTPSGPHPLPPVGAAPAAARWIGAPAHAEQLADAVARSAQAGTGDTLARLHRLANFSHLHTSEAALTRAITAVLEARRAAPLTKDHARYLRAQQQLRAGEIDAGRAALRGLGLATGGWWLGPFEYGAGAALTTPLGPEVDAGPRDWRALDGIAPDGVLPLGAVVYPQGPGAGFVAVAARAERATRVALRVGATDGVVVWVNGRRALERDVRRFAALDQDAVGVRLEPGLNWVLVKLAWSGDVADVLLRWSAPRGGPAAGVAWTYARPALDEAMTRFPLGTEPAKTRPVPGPLDGLDHARRRRAADALALRADLVAVLGLYDQRARPTEPERLLREVIDADPSDPRARFYFAHRVRGVDASLSRSALVSALVADQGYAPALLSLGDGARDGGRLIEARQHLDQALVADPDLAGAHLGRAALGFELLDEEALALARLESAMRTRPALDLQPALHLKLAHMRRALGDAAGARESAERALTLDATNPSARALAADLALDAGDFATALTHIELGIRLRPASIALRAHRARVLAGAPGGLPKARAAVELDLRLFGHHPSVHLLAAELAARAKDEAAAVLALRAALALDPQLVEPRRYLRALTGGQERLEHRYARDAAALAKAPVTDAEKSWGAVYLDDIEVVQLFANDKSARFRQSILRLHNPRLEDALRVHQVPYVPSRETVEIIAAERIRANGEVVPAAAIRDEAPRGKVAGMYIDQRYKVVLFDAVEAGDVVHIQYRVDTVGENIFGGFFGDLSALQEALPKRERTYRVIAPASRPLYTAQIGLPEPAEKALPDGQRSWTWRVEDLPGLEPEPLGPPYPEIGKLASVSSYATWADLGAWYGPLYRDQMRLDDAARAAGRAAVGDAEDPAEKARRLYRYVVENTRYVGIELGIHGWKPYAASEVHRRRYGDCKDKATLLAALLEDNGVKASLTLVRTSDKGRLPVDHATMWAFNHAITYVPELDLFLDPTAEFNGSRELPWADQGAMALVVNQDGTAKQVDLPTSSAPENLNASEYEAVLRRDSSLVLDGEERFAGAPAADLRRRLQEPEQRLRELETPLADLLPGAKVESATFSDLADIEAPVSYRYRVRVPRYGRQDQDALSVPVALFRHQVSSTYATLAERRYDLHVTHPWQTRNVIRYRLPKGAQVELPKGATIETPYVSLVQKIRRTEDGFQTDDTVTFSKRVVPAHDYPAFREACLAIDRALSRQVVIRW